MFRDFSVVILTTILWDLWSGGTVGYRVCTDGKTVNFSQSLYETQSWMMNRPNKRRLKLSKPLNGLFRIGIPRFNMYETPKVVHENSLLGGWMDG